MRKPITKPEIVINHLRKDGRITDAVARAAYGSFRLADAIYRLRTDRTDLVPKGMQIVTIDREDVAGNRFAEYRLIPKTPSFMAATAQETKAYA
ncbi:hypothetical protein [Caulobacter segnis]|uniref:Uncharacterized protein n=1 Tax=Caulobacter segnis TaxID=88688 RepID=A0A2W5V9Z5_9CAUL|nr:hypothetical protein [Caulobacter segnis]PZR36062.1 MAG: hypothetical protein DI526_04640 [Caulobacter segnis]